MPLTQAQLVTAVAERTQLSKSDAKRALAALDEVVLEELGNAQKVRIGGLVQLTVRVKPPQKPRKGRNPATGEEITVAAKPASVDLRARPLARAKGALPSVQKARRGLAAWAAWLPAARQPTRCFINKTFTRHSVIVRVRAPWGCWSVPACSGYPFVRNQSRKAIFIVVVAVGA